MKYNLLSNTGVLVSELCFGTMTFGGKGYWENIGKVQQDDATSLVKAALDGGINFFDTANIYSYGESEKLFGEAIRQLGVQRHQFVLATKVRGRMGEGVNNVGLSRYHIMRSVDESLQRLQMDHVDILYVHGVDPLTAIEETMRALNDVVVAGKVRYIGVCNWPAWQVMQAQGIAEKHGWNKIVALQYFYSIAGRDIEREILPMAIDQKLAVMPWSPLAGGFLSGKFTRDTQNTGGGSRRDNFDFPPVNKEKAYDIVDAMIAIGRKHEVTAAEVALSWVRQQHGITSTIIGAKHVDQVHQNVHSTTVKLNDEELKTLHELSALPKEYPGWMVERQAADRSVQ
jgi:aryl-alcohol dehydrogenase-like predicted oxidoreductase